MLGVRPRLVAHGHFHVAGEAVVRLPGADHDTTIWTLPANGDPANVRLLDLATLAFPELTAPRQAVLDALVDLCRADPDAARRTLGLPPGLADLVGRNADLPLAATSGIADPTGQTVTITLVDPRTGAERTAIAILPPGALGRPVELASLIVHAH